MRRRSLYKYFSEPQWADCLLSGQMLFRSLSYFRDYEDQEVRRDRNEGLATLRPEGGLVITNRTRGTTFTMPEGAFESSVKEQDIFIFCLSRSLTPELRERFEAVRCVEILDVPVFCRRIQAALPEGATFPGPYGKTRIGQRVAYYTEKNGVNPRWALPDVMATTKPASYRWQDEFRLMFSVTGAFGFEQVVTNIVRGQRQRTVDPERYHEHLVKAAEMRDICCLHEFGAK